MQAALTERGGSVSEVGVKSRKEAGESPEVSISTIVTSDDQGVQIY